MMRGRWQSAQRLPARAHRSFRVLSVIDIQVWSNDTRVRGAGRARKSSAKLDGTASSAADCQAATAAGLCQFVHASVGERNEPVIRLT